MRRLILALACSASLGLSACAAGPLPEVASASTDRVILNGTRALILAANGYQAAAAVAEVGVRAGQFDRATLLRIREINDKAAGVIIAGGAVRARAGSAAELFRLTSDLLSIVRPSPPG